MRTPFRPSRRVAVPFILATASLSLLVLHCSSDTGTQASGAAGTTALPTSGAGGTASQGGSSSGMAGGGTTSGGTVNGTAGTLPTAGTAGTAGANTGGGGAGGSGGSAGAAGSSGSGGGNGGSPLFAAVKTLMAKTCGVGKCHNAASGELDYQAMDGKLYQRLTSAVPAGTKHCVGSKPVVANDPNSLLLQAIKAKGAVCMKEGGGTEMIGQMPDNCPTKEGIACLTDAEIKIFADWVAAGAPM